MMRRAVITRDAGSVKHKGNRRFMHRNVEKELIEGAI